MNTPLTHILLHALRLQNNDWTVFRIIIIQISYASTLAALSDRTRYKRYFRNNLPIAAPALHSTLDHFKWTRIALLTQDESLFTVVRLH